MNYRILSKRHKRIRAPKDCEKGLPYTEIIVNGERINTCEKLESIIFQKQNNTSLSVNSSIIHNKFLRNEFVLNIIPRFLNVPNKYTQKSDIALDKLNVDTLILGSGIGGISALQYCTSCVLITNNIEDEEVFYDPLSNVSIVNNIKNIIKQKSDKIIYGTFMGKFDEGLLFKIDKKYYIINFKNIIIANGGRYIPPIFPNNDVPGIVSRNLFLKYAKMFKDIIVIGSTDPAIKTAIFKKSDVIVKSGTQNFSKIWLEKAKDNGINIIQTNSISVKRIGKKLKIYYDNNEKIVDGIVYAIVKQPRIEAIANLGYKYTFYPNLSIYMAYHDIYGNITDNAKIVGGARGLYDEEISYLSGKIIYNNDIDQFIEELKNTPLYDFYTHNEWKPIDSPYVFGNGYICECEDIKSEEVQEKINKGYKDVESLKRTTGICTGYCQGKICSYLAGSLIKSNTLITFRSPLYILW
ncbi:ferredoxin [Acidianus sulfidivorans JP7]|uniref:Ferredoxin n=1 Tax=Acidianus sulfidivorans JP7 TaxID=619593 RepID=A0A2U9IMP8_9CREN|nr:(2Fe-2S)-binding protein [Acidianus sulfidivorans]AWR97339.1 ferredoxin [Acidianus sulfidivorans JP7]